MPLHHGCWLRVYNFSKSLVEFGESVTIFSYSPEQTQHKDVIERIPVGVVTLAGASPPDRGNGRTILSAHVFDPTFARFLTDHVNGFDVVVLVGEKLLQYAPEARAASIVLADIIDSPRLTWMRSARGHVDRLRSTIKAWLRYWHERRLTDLVDAVLFASQPDADAFKADFPSVISIAIPNGVDAGYFDPATINPSANADVNVLLSGNMDFEPNVDAARFLVKEIAPLVWRVMPNVRIVLAGASPLEEICALANSRVVVTGTVPDMRPYLLAASVISVPMRMGTGVKNKLLEAWAMARPVVATPLACQGIPIRDGEELLLAASAQDHARSICRLLADRVLAERLGAAGRAFILSRYSWRSAGHALIELARSFEGVMPEGGERSRYGKRTRVEPQSQC